MRVSKILSYLIRSGECCTLHRSKELKAVAMLQGDSNEAKERLPSTLAPASRDCPRLCICLRRVQKLALLRQFEPFFHSQMHCSAALNGIKDKITVKMELEKLCVFSGYA